MHFALNCASRSCPPLAEEPFVAGKLNGQLGFVSHPAEGRRLAARAYREAVAEGIYAGVERFVADTRRARTL